MAKVGDIKNKLKALDNVYKYSEEAMEEIIAALKKEKVEVELEGNCYDNYVLIFGKGEKHPGFSINISIEEIINNLQLPKLEIHKVILNKEKLEGSITGVIRSKMPV